MRSAHRPQVRVCSAVHVPPGHRAEQAAQLMPSQELSVRVHSLERTKMLCSTSSLQHHSAGSRQPLDSCHHSLHAPITPQHCMQPTRLTTHTPHAGTAWWCLNTTLPAPSPRRAQSALAALTFASTQWTLRAGTSWWGAPCPSGTPGAAWPPSRPTRPGCCASLTRWGTV